MRSKGSGPSIRRLAAAVIDNAFDWVREAERFRRHSLPQTARMLRARRAPASELERDRLAKAIEIRMALEADLRWFERPDGFEWWVSVLHYEPSIEAGIAAEFRKRATRMLSLFREALDVDSVAA